MTKQEIFDNYNEYILSTYTRMPVIFTQGKGCYLTDIDGKKYLDFFPGWGVSNLGHCHPKVMAGVRDQIKKLIHLPNNFYHTPQVKLAKEIILHAFPGKVFFCNSGAEANEAAIKIARAYGKGKRFEIITTENSFHGRTLGALTATGQKKHHVAFEPLVPGFKSVSFNDLNAVKQAITPQTIGVMLELVQGEGGINIADKSYVEGLRALCDAHDLLLIVDEVQTGLGRTGEMFAFKHYGITPDVMTLAKALGGGLPIGAMVAGKRIADVFKPGMHGSTFGGGPVVCKAALGVFKAIQSYKLVQNSRAMGAYLLQSLQGLKTKYSFIQEVRGLGLMTGVHLNIEGKAIVEKCLAKGLLINCTQGNILRIMPALIVTKRQIHEAVHILDEVLADLKKEMNV